MAKNASIDLSLVVEKTPAGTIENSIVARLVQDMVLTDAPGVQDYPLAAGAANVDIMPPNISGNGQLLIIPDYLVNGSGAGYGLFSVKVTHATGDSTFQGSSGMWFSILDTDTAVEITNLDGTNAATFSVVHFKLNGQ